MASNLQKRLDKIERGLQQFLEAQNPSGPIYITDGETAPEGREAIAIIMQWVEASHQEDAETSQAGAVGDGQSLEGQKSAQRKNTSTPPSLETPAEREKRWQKHLQAIERQGQRYEGGGPQLTLRERDMRRGIV